MNPKDIPQETELLDYQLTRRRFLTRTSANLGVAAVASLMNPGLIAATNPKSSKAGGIGLLGRPHHQAKAKRVIYLFQSGGPSHIDLFDPKPRLNKEHGKDLPPSIKGTQRVTLMTRNQKRFPCFGTPFKFKQHGRAGHWFSNIVPHMASVADELCFIKGLHTEPINHDPAMTFMQTGRGVPGLPSIGSWLNYGLGSENENLPGFVVMLDPRGGPISGAKNWSAGYMPASFQATIMRSQGTAILNLKRPSDFSDSMQRRLLDTLRAYNNEHQLRRIDNSDLAARIASYELAYRMQSSAPEATDLSKETKETQQAYGLDRKESSYFGRQCLLARRLVERGVRFIQVYSGGNHNDANWDAHGDLKRNHDMHALETDKPIAGLINDLKQRGLFEKTLIVWGGEFGRQPTAEYAKGTGRDHNSYGFTMWMAGGGIKGGANVGKTDELGSAAVEDRFHVRNLHATVLQQMGLDPNRLSYFFNGLDQKLVGVEGADPIRQIMA